MFTKNAELKLLNSISINTLVKRSTLLCIYFYCFGTFVLSNLHSSFETIWSVNVRFC